MFESICDKDENALMYSVAQADYVGNRSQETAYNRKTSQTAVFVILDSNMHKGALKFQQLVSHMREKTHIIRYRDYSVSPITTNIFVARGFLLRLGVK